MASSSAHRLEAERLLEHALNYPPSSAARLATLAEAQVHATLSAIPDAPAKTAPVRVPTRKATTAKEAVK